MGLRVGRDGRVSDGAEPIGPAPPTRATGGRRARRWGALAVAGALLATVGCRVVPGDPGTAAVLLEVDATADVRVISPLVYGTNGAPAPIADEVGLVRLGGNRWTAYNWENNASNAGSDWCYQNDGYLSSSAVPGEAVRPTLDEAAASGRGVLLTVPIVDHVAADKAGGCDVRNTPDYLTTRMRANHASGGPGTTTPDTGDADVYQDQFVRWVHDRAPDARVLYSLDNEPDLWADTHPEVHPDKVTYAELVARTIEYGAAIKGVDPGAEVAGPVSYGFYGFERLQDAPDAAGRNFVDFYLDQLAAAEAGTGLRHVDLLDLHWYPEARGGGVRITGTDTTAAVVAARVQAPRSLWDPTYVEDSWITTDYGYGPIRLLPRMRDKIDAHYPGTGLALTEWNYGGGGHISGAVATADVLGVLGQQGVEAATFWPLHADESYSYAAFRAFLDYDGAGSGFGDQAVRSTSSDVGAVTVYGSRRSADPRQVVLVVVNKSTAPTTVGLKLAALVRYSRADVYTITAAGGPAPVAQPSVAPVDVNAWNTTLPPLSVTVLVPAV